MKLGLFIILGLAFLFMGLSPQLRTKLRPAYPAVRRVNQKVWGVQTRRGVVFVGYARLA